MPEPFEVVDAGYILKTLEGGLQREVAQQMSRFGQHKAENTFPRTGHDEDGHGEEQVVVIAEIQLIQMSSLYFDQEKLHHFALSLL